MVAERAGDRLPFDFTSDTDPAHLSRLRELAEYDVVLVDTPGSLEGHDVLTAVLSASDFVILPTEPAALAVMPLLRSVRDVVDPHGVPYRVLLNLVDPRSSTEIDEARQLLNTAGVPTFTTAVREYKAHKRAPLDGLVVTQYSGRDRYAGKAVDDYRRVALELLAEWSGSTRRAVTLAGGR